MEEIPDGSSTRTNERVLQPQAEAQADVLGEKLKVLIDNLPSRGVTVAEIRDLVGQEGLLLLTIFLSLVFMVPVSIPGVSTVFGGAILLIGVSRMIGCSLWLPKGLAQRVLPADRVRTALTKGGVWLHRLERISRPHRLSRLVSNGLVGVLSNGALIVGALLLMAPFGLIPFSNTLPALALLFLALGLLQHDGLCILFGHFANIATVIYFSILLVGGGTVIHEGFRFFACKGA